MWMGYTIDFGDSVAMFEYESTLLHTRIFSRPDFHQPVDGLLCLLGKKQQRPAVLEDDSYTMMICSS
jgi:hypothetical protein